MAGTEDPGLGEVEADGVDSQGVAHGVSPEHFQGEDGGFLERLGVALEVEHVDGGIVAGRGHEGVLLVVVDPGHACFVEGHRLVGLAAEVQVVADQLSGQMGTLLLPEPTMM